MPDKNISEVSCVYGAFYFTNKSWYNYTGGWDTIAESKLSGHRFWGSLEPWLCLKNYLYGGTCHVVTDIESLHIFHKFRDEPSPHGRSEYFWYNKAFIAHTMLSDADAERLIKKIYTLRVKYELFTYPFNVGMKLIRQNWDYVYKTRERNRKMFKHDFDWYCNKFNIIKNF